jgi:hypothetical protein
MYLPRQSFTLLFYPFIRYYFIPYENISAKTIIKLHLKARQEGKDKLQAKSHPQHNETQHPYTNKHNPISNNQRTHNPNQIKQNYNKSSPPTANATSPTTQLPS